MRSSSAALLARAALRAARGQGSGSGAASGSGASQYALAASASASTSAAAAAAAPCRCGGGSEGPSSSSGGGSGPFGHARPASHAWASASQPAAAAAWGRRHKHDHAHEQPCSHGDEHAGHAQGHGHAHEPASSSGGGGGGNKGGAHVPAQSFEEQEAACWSCNDRHKRGSLLCRSCDRIQPADGTLTHFDILGIDPTFDIDPAALERRYKLLQWTLHPDKAVTRTPQERGFSAEHASHINQAYGVLRRPLSRANYLLMLAGVPAGDAFEGTLEDPELLMEVMEDRERVESTDDPSQLRALLEANAERQRAAEARLSGAFKSGDLAAAARLVAELTYYVRLEEAITAKL